MSLKLQVWRQKHAFCKQTPDMGFAFAAGHALDQKRLQEPLYRHPWDDVLYTQ
jgi:hypothetical protein